MTIELLAKGDPVALTAVIIGFVVFLGLLIYGWWIKLNEIHANEMNSVPATAKCRRCGNIFDICLNDGNDWICGTCNSSDWEVVKQ